MRHGKGRDAVVLPFLVIRNGGGNIMVNNEAVFMRMIEIRNVFYAVIKGKAVDSEAVEKKLRGLLRYTEEVVRLMERELPLDMDALHFEKANRQDVGSEGYEKASCWIPVEEALPERGEVVAVTCVTKSGVRNWNRAYLDENGFWHGSGSMSGVVAWMPVDVYHG